MGHKIYAWTSQTREGLIEKNEEKNFSRAKAWLNIDKCGNHMLEECVNAREFVRDHNETAQHYAFARAQTMRGQLNQFCSAIAPASTQTS